MNTGPRGADIEFGPLRETDYAGISALITRMAKDGPGQSLRDKSAGYYRWMYEANPAGHASVWSARRSDQVIASFAVAPKLFQIDGRVVLLGKTMDMFTDPEYQGQGLIKECTQRAFDLARESGIEGWYVTPSVNSYPIFKGKWGYCEDLELVYRFRILDISALVSAAVKPAKLGRAAATVVRTVSRTFSKPAVLELPPGFHVSPLNRFDSDVDTLWSKIAKGYRVALVRDARYLNWRYVDNPDSYAKFGLYHQDQLVGLVVLKTTQRRGVQVGDIVDYLCPVNDDDIRALLVKIAINEFRRRGCSFAQAWSIKGTRTDASLRRAGLTWRRAGVKFLVSPGLGYPAIHDPGSWLLTQGDGNDV